MKKERYAERSEKSDAMRQQRLPINRRHVADRPLAGHTGEREQIDTVDTST